MQKLYLGIISSLLIVVTVIPQTFAESLPDISAGEKRAAVCFACHGANGISKLGDIPHLAGQNRVYLEKSLHLYREGQKRQDPTMNAMAKPLSDSDIVNIAAYFSLQTRMDNGQTCTQELETMARIQKIGTVITVATQKIPAIKPQNSATATPKSIVRTGEEVYAASCVACHATGVMSAPKLGDKAAWSKRVEKGLPTLLQNARTGCNAMPPKGGCAACSDEEIQAAVKYLAGDESSPK
jgi:cytochrome c5